MRTIGSTIAGTIRPERPLASGTNGERRPLALLFLMLLWLAKEHGWIKFPSKKVAASTPAKSPAAPVATSPAATPAAPATAPASPKASSSPPSGSSAPSGEGN